MTGFFNNKNCLVKPKTNFTNHLSWTREVNLNVLKYISFAEQIFTILLDITYCKPFYYLLFLYNEPIVHLISFSFIFNKFTFVTVI